MNFMEKSGLSSYDVPAILTPTEMDDVYKSFEGDLEMFVQESLSVAVAETSSVASRNISTETSTFREPTTASKLAVGMSDEGDLADFVNGEADVSETTSTSSTNIPAKTEISSVNELLDMLVRKHQKAWQHGFKIVTSFRDFKVKPTAPLSRLSKANSRASISSHGT